MKTPEETKKGLKCCAITIDDGESCYECPYHHSNNDGVAMCLEVYGDALAYIEQLERERDAAIEALHDVRASVAGLVCMVDSKDEKIPKWANVAEHLPQKPGKYLVYSKVGTMYTSKFDPNIHKRWPHFGKVGVTHWMPRPEEPKEDAE